MRTTLNVYPELHSSLRAGSTSESVVCPQLTIMATLNNLVTRSNIGLTRGSRIHCPTIPPWSWLRHRWCHIMIASLRKCISTRWWTIHKPRAKELEHIQCGKEDPQGKTRFLFYLAEIFEAPSRCLSRWVTCRFTGSTTVTSKYWCREVAVNGFGTWSSRSWLPFKQSSATWPPEKCNDLRQHDALDFKLRVAIHWVIWLIRGTCVVMKVEEIFKWSHSRDDVPSPLLLPTARKHKIVPLQ